MNSANQFQVFFHGKIGGHGGLLGGDTDDGLDPVRLLGDAVTAHPGVALRGFAQTGQQLDGGGLSCTVDPQQGKQLPPVDLKV